MTKTMIQYEINQIQTKLRYIAAYDLYDVYDVAYLENRLKGLKAELHRFEIK